jgi:hypothetical protein
MSMNWRLRGDPIHTWWQQLPEERYWLDVTDRHGRDRFLRAPRGDGASSASWTYRLITHIKDGDVIVHYDSLQQAIVGWSLASGRAVKRNLPAPKAAERAGDAALSESVPSWVVELHPFTPLAPAVALPDIARAQWDLFPELRALEDRVGEPLYYPFEMGSRDATRPLSGNVFKLPAVFIRAFPELERAAGRVARAHAPNGTLSPGRSAAARHVPLSVR